MKRQNVVTVDYVLKTSSFLMVDSNAFIFHYPLEIHQKLNDPQFSREKKKQWACSYEKQICEYYQEWIRLLSQYSNICITRDVFDLELSGQNFVSSTQQSYYRYKYQKEGLPRGSILRSFDTEEIQQTKKYFLEHLQGRCINAQVKVKKPGLRQILLSFLQETLQEPLWQQLSKIDREMISNTLALGRIYFQEGALLTNDVFLSNAFWMFLQKIKQTPTAMFPSAFQEEFEGLKHACFQCYGWSRPEKREILLLSPRNRLVSFPKNRKNLEEKN